MSPDTSNRQSEAAAIIAVAREAETNKAPSVITIGSRKQLVLPNGTIINLERFEDTPRRQRSIVDLYETASFINYLNSYKLTGRTTVFGKATELGGGFTAIIDGHEEVIRKEPDPDKPETTPPVLAETVGVAGWGEHRVSLKLETTPEWARWVANNAKFMSQEAFAEFIEDNLNDINTPDGATILEMSQGLQGTKSVNFKSGKNLKDGAIKFEYVETVLVQNTTNQRNDSFTVPDKFQLLIVPFVGANGVFVEARLRFRIGQDGKLTFAYILNRPYKIIEEAFALARGEIEENTGLTVLLGTGSISNSTS